MDRSLDSLSSDARPIMDRVLARLVEAGVAVMIVQTSRTPEEAAQNIANGTSATEHSKHLPRRLRGRGNGTPDDDRADAIDLCPYQLYQLVGPDKLQWIEKATPASALAFAKIGQIGESLGLRWGGRWMSPHDPGHLEWLFPGERYKDIPAGSAAAAEHRA